MGSLLLKRQQRRQLIRNLVICILPVKASKADLNSTILVSTKRKVDWDQGEESEQEDNTSSGEESDSEDSRIKDVLNNLSTAISRQKASSLLHRTAASKDILF